MLRRLCSVLLVTEVLLCLDHYKPAPIYREVRVRGNFFEELTLKVDRGYNFKAINLKFKHVVATSFLCIYLVANQQLVR